nr:serine/threonine protein kinase [Prevotella sp.]
DDSSASGYLMDSFEGVSQTFTDVEIISTSEVNVVARARRYGRWWLLKGLRQEVADEMGFQQRLRKELEILMRLQHPHVVAAYQIEHVDHLGLCIVMEYVEGQTLRDWLEGETSRRARRDLVLELVDTLVYIHSMGVVHRDLKPENMVVSNNGSNLKVIDFGLSDTDSHTILKQPAGTLRYMSPEQMQTSVADVRNDIYSCGVIMQQMNLGVGYRHIINKCLQPIERRYKNSTELQNAILAIDGYKKKTFAALLFALIAVLLLMIGMQMRKVTAQEELIAQLSSSQGQDQSIMQQRMAQLYDTIERLREDNISMREKENAAKTKRVLIANAIGKGKAVIDNKVAQEHLDQHFDTLSNIAYLRPDYTDVALAINKAVEDYMAQVKADFSASEIIEISTSLDQHYASKIKMWNKKIESLIK